MRKLLIIVLGVISFNFFCFGEFKKLRMTVFLCSDELILCRLRGDDFELELRRGDVLRAGSMVFNLVKFNE